MGAGAAAPGIRNTGAGATFTVTWGGGHTAPGAPGGGGGTGGLYPDTGTGTGAGRGATAGSGAYTVVLV